MDPNDCLDELCDALRNDDPETAHDRGEDLLRWIGSDGFTPTVTTSQLRTMVSNLLMYVEITGLDGQQ